MRSRSEETPNGGAIVLLKFTCVGHPGHVSEFREFLTSGCATEQLGKKRFVTRRRPPQVHEQRLEAWDHVTSGAFDRPKNLPSRGRLTRAGEGHSRLRRCERARQDGYNTPGDWRIKLRLTGNLASPTSQLRALLRNYLNISRSTDAGTLDCRIARVRRGIRRVRASCYHLLD
jgi:hypothetical protein